MSTTTLTITLSDVAPTGGQVVNLTTASGLVRISPTSVTIPQNQTTASVTVTSTATSGNDTITAAGTGLTSGTDGVQVQARTFSLNAGLVGLSRTAQGLITLSQPAPTGGATIFLSVANSSLVSVSPSSVTIPAGQTTASFTLTGGASVGTTTLTANGSASGYATQTATLTITNLLLNLSTAQTLAFGQAGTYQVQIAPNAAPAGGVVVSLSSSNTSVATVPSTVNIPAGAFGVNFAVTAGTTATGTTTITATNANFAPTTTTAAVTAALSLAETSKTLSSTQTDTVDFQLTSGGNLYAPTAGVTVTGSSSNTACVTLSSTSITVAAGQTFGSLPIAYGGTATLPCTSTVTITNALYGSASIPVTFQAAANLGTISISSASPGVGGGLQTAVSVSLSTAAPTGGVTVELRSANPAVLLVSPAASAIGAPAINLVFPAGSNNATVYLDGVVGTIGSVTLSATTAKYTSAIQTISVLPSVVLIYNAPTTTTPISGKSGFGALVAAVYGTSGSASNIQPQSVNPNTGTVIVTSVSSKPSVGELQTGTTNAATATTTIGVGYTYSGGNNGTGLTFVPLSNGTTTLSVSAPGFGTASSTNYGYASSDAVTVTGAGMTVNAQNAATGQAGVGVGLETQGSVILGAPAPSGGATIQLTSSDPTQFVLSPDGVAMGTGSINVSIAAGNTIGYFYVIGIKAGTTATLGASNSAGYYSAAAAVAVTVNPSLVLLYNPPTNTTPLSGTSGFGALVGVAYSTSGTTTNILPEAVSPNTGSLTVTVSSSTPSVGELQTGTTNAASATTTIGVGYTYSGSNNGTGLTFVPLSNGTTTLSVSAPGFGTASSTNYGYASSDAVTVTGAGMTVNAQNAATGQAGVGVGLETQGSVILGAPAPSGGATIQLTSSDPTQFVLSPDGVAMGTGSINVSIAAGNTIGYFYVIGIKAGTTATLGASNSAGYYSAAAAVAVTVNPSLVLLYNPPTNTTPLSGTSGFGALVGVAYSTSGTTTNILPEAVSPNTGSLTVTVSSSTPSVGELQTGTTNAASATTTIGVGYIYSGSNNGTGLTFVPLSNGTTTLSVSAPGFGTAASTNYGYASSNVVTVADAALTLQSGVQIGSGLQYQMSGSLQAANDGGVTIRIASSDATKLLVSPDAVTPGTPFIDIFVNNGTAGYSFYAQGIAGAVGTVTLTATTADTSFATGTATVNVVEPQLEIYNGLPTEESASSADAPFQIGTYVPGYAYENVAVGATLTVTLTSSSTAAASLTTSSQIQTSPVTVTIAAGTDLSPATVSGGGVALHAVGPGTTNITATAPGTLQVGQAVILN
jgi:hypothetical protein